MDLDLPRDQLVVVTGLSGSGKSSLAFDTLYAEGQRRYIESLSAYARQFLDQMSKPDVDAIEGLSPALSIEQRSVTKSPRSTVGTLTEITDHLRLLYARAGTPHCWKCDRVLSSQSVPQMAERILETAAGRRVEVLAPVVQGRKGEHKKELQSLRDKGFVRARIDGDVVDLAEDVRLARSKTHDIDVVVDRIAVKESARERITGSLETAIQLSGGLVWIQPEEGSAELLSASSACSGCGVSFPELAPRLFSFNGPHGACPRCGGLGTHDEFDPERIVPEPERSLAEGAIAPWRGRKQARYYQQLLESVCTHLDVDMDTPFGELPARKRKAILFGTGDARIPMRFQRRRRRATEVERKFDGVVGSLERERREEGLEAVAKYTSPGACPDCEGSRLRIEARSVRLGGRSLPELSALPIAESRAFLEALELRATERAVAERVLLEIRERLRFLVDVGLGYLSLDRPSGTLSGGESQRIRLATQVGSSLMGVLYILDEPSIGLHPRDNERLLASLERLRDVGNSVLVVEHDEATVRRADWVVDMGPGAGRHGGAVVAQGTPAEIEADPESLTGAFLSGRRGIPVPARRPLEEAERLVIRDCQEHNLRGVDLSLPLGRLDVVTGVSGSGKSSRVIDTLHRALARRLHGAEAPAGLHGRIEGLDRIDKVVQIDQAPIGRTPRSNPATYIKVFDEIRSFFA
ncbi:MAG: excinuclease ABC subunit UvrA, partial [Myxococcota bacterium]|nr:excinuclease ABC subunit UvrA [Myxococcota bacterium]